MNPIRHIRRIAGVLAGACALLAFAAAGPALAMTAMIPRPDPGSGVPGATLAPAPVPPPVHTVTRTVVAGGMPGWQIALIAVGAALLAATVTALADRARAARRHAAPTAA